MVYCFWGLVRVCCCPVPLHYPVCAAGDVPPEMKPTYQLNSLVMDLKGFLSSYPVIDAPTVRDAVAAALVYVTIRAPTP